MSTIERYLVETESMVRNISRTAVRAVVDALTLAWQREATIFLIGNGGSASTASHMMNDLCKFTRTPGKKPLKAIALTDNVPFITAVGNDISFEQVFSFQLETLMNENDVLIAISASGNSPNIVRACEYAKTRNAVIIGFCGKDGSALASMADHKIVIEEELIGHQEDAHLILNHVISFSLRDYIQSPKGSHEYLETIREEVHLSSEASMSQT